MRLLSASSPAFSTKFKGGGASELRAEAGARDSVRAARPEIVRADSSTYQNLYVSESVRTRICTRRFRYSQRPPRPPPRRLGSPAEVVLGVKRLFCPSRAGVDGVALPSVKRLVMGLSSPTPNARLVQVEIVDGRPRMGMSRCQGGGSFELCRERGSVLRARRTADASRLHRKALLFPTTIGRAPRAAR